MHQIFVSLAIGIKLRKFSSPIKRLVTPGKHKLRCSIISPFQNCEIKMQQKHIMFYGINLLDRNLKWIISPPCRLTHLRWKVEDYLLYLILLVLFPIFFSLITTMPILLLIRLSCSFKMMKS